MGDRQIHSALVAINYHVVLLAASFVQSATLFYKKVTIEFFRCYAFKLRKNTFYPCNVMY